MTLLRRVPPVHSPLSARAVLAAFGSAEQRPALAADLERAYGAAEALLTASGTDALTVALRAAAAARPARPCVLPAYACYDLATAALGASVGVRLYDVDPATLTPEPRSLARALDGGAAALVIVHLFGIPVPMDAMRAAAKGAGAVLIEDAAQGSGGQWEGRPLGAHGDLGILSFGRGKGETGGGGGALLVRDPTLLTPALRDALSVAPPGAIAAGLKLAAQWLLGRPALYAIPTALPMLRLGETVFKEPGPVRGMSPGSARVLAHTRALTAPAVETRRAHVARYARLVAGSPGAVAPSDPDRARAGWLRYPVSLRITARQLATGRPLGVVRGYPIPLHRLDAMRPLLVDEADAPGAERLARELCTLPTHEFLTAHDLDALAQWLAAASG